MGLCKADSGVSAMIGILAAISSHPGLVARCKILSYTCSCLVSYSAPIVRAQDKGARIFGGPQGLPPSLSGCFASGAGARGPGPGACQWPGGWRPLWQRPFFHL